MNAITPVAPVVPGQVYQFTTLSAIRHFLGQAHDGNWYIVPAHKRGDWEKFLATTSRVTRHVPDYAKPIPSPSQLTFTDPREYK